MVRGGNMSNAFDEMKNLKNGSYTRVNQKEESNNFKSNSEKGSKMKNFVLKWGRKIVDFNTAGGIALAVFVFLVLFGIGIGCLAPDEYGSYSRIQNAPILFILSFLLPIVILFLTIMWNYFMYLLVDIRDSLKNIDNKM